MKPKTKSKATSKQKWNSATSIKGLTQQGDFYYYRIPQADLMEGQTSKRFALGTTDFGEAIELIDKIRTDQFEKQANNPINDLIEPFLNEKRRAGAHTGKATETTTASALKIFAERFQKPLGKITTKDLERWRGEMFDRELSAATIKGYLARAAAFMAWLKKRGQILRNPFDELEIPKKLPRRRGRYCNKELRDQIINSCENPDLKALLFFGFWAGMRLNEALNVRPLWFELDPETQLPTYIIIQDETGQQTSQDFKIKGREGYKIMPVAAPLANFLVHEYDLIGKIERGDPFVILPGKVQGSNRYRWQPKRSWKTLMKKNGCEWVTIQTMRHTFMTLALSTPNGPTPQHLAQWTGTEVDTIMENYAHLIDGGNELINLIK